jgi:hypothetical protein
VFAGRQFCARQGRLGQFLPRYLTESATALSYKAAAPTVRRRGSYGPMATFRAAEDDGPTDLQYYEAPERIARRKMQRLISALTL